MHILFYLAVLPYTLTGVFTWFLLMRHHRCHAVVSLFCMPACVSCWPVLCFVLGLQLLLVEDDRE
jgi:hypothetical protein